MATIAASVATQTQTGTDIVGSPYNRTRSDGAAVRTLSAWLPEAAGQRW
jgi:hypothetical protein